MHMWLIRGAIAKKKFSVGFCILLQGSMEGFCDQVCAFETAPWQVKLGNTAYMTLNEERILEFVLCQIYALFSQADADLDLLVAFWRENKASYDKGLELLH